MIEEGTKGICRLAVIPVRGEASHRAEQVTQLLFGEHYEITQTSADGEWYRVRIHHDGYEGWLQCRQHTAISQAYYDQINISNYKISLEFVTAILYRKRPLNILLGSVLPISTSELFKMEEQLAFNGEAKALGQRMDYEFLKRIAMKYLNAPYQWGGRSPFGIDCSGFTQMVFRFAGYSLLRDASQQAGQGKPVEGGISEAKPGDLAFFTGDSGKINHVGMITEESKIIHASGRVRIDPIDGKGIFVESTGKYTHNLAFVRRLLKN